MSLAERDFRRIRDFISLTPLYDTRKGWSFEREGTRSGERKERHGEIDTEKEGMEGRFN